MTKRFKSKTVDEKLATLDRKLNLIMKVMAIKPEKPVKKPVDTEAMEQRFVNRKPATL